MADVSALLDDAREAATRADWRGAYASLTQAQEFGPLHLEDLILLGDAAWWAGSTKVAVATAEAVFGRLVRQGALERAGKRATELAMLWINRGDFTIASAWLNRAERTLADVPECVASGYMRYLRGWSVLMIGDHDGAYAEAAAVQDLGVRADVPGLASLGLLLSGLCDIQCARTASGFAKLDEAMLPVLAAAVEPMWAGEVYCAVIDTCHKLGDLSRMRAWTDALDRWLAELPDAMMLNGMCRIHRSQLWGPDDVLTDITRELGDVCAGFVDRNLWVAAAGYVALGDACRLSGEYERAAEAYRHARELGTDPQPGEALLTCAAGKPASAATALRGALDAATGYTRAALLRALVLVETARGSGDTAESACAELAAVAAEYPTPGFRAWAAQCRGAVLAARGDYDRAIRELTSAAREFRAQHARYDLAQVYESLAQAHRGVGAVDVADADVAIALSIYRQLGAEPDVRRLGRDTAAPGGLTPREVEILGRIALGASNKEVAAAAYITEKTVGRHLANIYAKIGVTSRTAAAAWARENAVV